MINCCSMRLSRSLHIVMHAWTLQYRTVHFSCTPPHSLIHYYITAQFTYFTTKKKIVHQMVPHSHLHCVHAPVYSHMHLPHHSLQAHSSIALPHTHYALHNTSLYISQQSLIRTQYLSVALSSTSPSLFVERRSYLHVKLIIFEVLVGNIRMRWQQYNTIFTSNLLTKYNIQLIWL